MKNNLSYLHVYARNETWTNGYVKNNIFIGNGLFGQKSVVWMHLD